MADNSLLRASFVRTDEDGLLLFRLEDGRLVGVEVTDELERGIIESKQMLAELNGPVQPHTEKTVPIKAIQTLLRAGATVGEVAAQFTVSEALVRRFAKPVTIEKMYQVEQFRHAHMPGSADPNETVESALQVNLMGRGVKFTDVQWSATRNGHSPWRIKATFPQSGAAGQNGQNRQNGYSGENGQAGQNGSNGQNGQAVQNVQNGQAGQTAQTVTAEWSFDNSHGVITCLDQEAKRLFTLPAAPATSSAPAGTGAAQGDGSAAGHAGYDGAYDNAETPAAQASSRSASPRSASAQDSSVRSTSARNASAQGASAQGPSAQGREHAHAVQLHLNGADAEDTEELPSFESSGNGDAPTLVEAARRAEMAGRRQDSGPLQPARAGQADTAAPDAVQAESAGAAADAQQGDGAQSRTKGDTPAAARRGTQPARRRPEFRKWDDIIFGE